MSEPIKAGDLVYCARPCKHCGDTQDLGYTYRVQEVSFCEGEKGCCGNEAPEWCAIDPLNDEGFALDEIKRIPPLEELDDVRREEEIHA